LKDLPAGTAADREECLHRRPDQTEMQLMFVLFGQAGELFDELPPAASSSNCSGPARAGWAAPDDRRL